LRSLAFVFDFGGVLMDWDARHLYRKYFDGDPQAMEAFLAEIDFAGWNRQQDEGRPFAEAVDVLSRQFPQYASLIRLYDERWEESVRGPIQPSVEILARLKAAGYPLYAISNWSLEKYSLIRPRHEFFDWFEQVLVSGEVKVAKPDPRIYQVFLERTGLHAGDCLFIDDSEPNIEVARRLGFQTIHFESPAKLEAALQFRGLLQPGAPR
jgi:2-haloacid dehalogenase